ncbi:hypothetical protein [Bradyrhizobium sp. LHD-71]|uniref:hypothetical protein n=1 Tax=Bradyrhizobium sp. LHD-71 TaxID=3072141 RepID=UPI00280CC009|nr:hypothetical protein [Bradyrhizobium sp. LHD-71]MDQ8727443.1 hypothetical protein [Bradyrhizobium sp. LHD-71]
MAVKTTRVADISALLRRTGLEPAATPEAWDKIGRWIGETVEGSREPGSDRYGPYLPYYPGVPPRQIKGESTSVLRPLWQSVVLDLALLLGGHMIARAPSARWSCDGEWREGSCSGEPLVAIPGQDIPTGHLPTLHGPFDAIESVAWQGLHRRQQLTDPPPISLGEILHNAIERPPSSRDPRQELIKSLEDYLNEHGDLPENEEIVDWMIDEGLLEMPELPSRLVSILDERDERAGRAGTKDAWR